MRDVVHRRLHTPARDFTIALLSVECGCALCGVLCVCGGGRLSYCAIMWLRYFVRCVYSCTCCAILFTEVGFIIF